MTIGVLALTTPGEKLKPTDEYPALALTVAGSEPAAAASCSNTERSTPRRSRLSKA